jgi:hypothetical protein
MKDKTSLKIERDIMVKECREHNIKIERKGKNVKQQVSYMSRLVAPIRKEKQDKINAKIKLKQEIKDAKKKAYEDKIKAEQEAKKEEVKQ